MALTLYRIYKFRQSGPPIMQGGYGRVTLERAREICGGPNSSSMQGKGEKAIEAWHKTNKHWFLGFTKD